ncbi:MAG: hypothetical protein SV239_14220 [Thermodesulfobacteriota bacterium]|nr:hypothetical protein [Thermodesulfobacteriota bacterium]
MIWKMHRLRPVANPLRDQEHAALRMALSGFSHARRLDPTGG